jgi:UDPglucose--hexose-1-phosphate uridylyltransferase
VNPDYPGTYVFDNDFAALTPARGRDAWSHDERGLLVARSESGRCRVVCFSPRHDHSLADLDPAGLLGVVQTWKAEYETLGADRDIRYVQIFENKGEVMGCSNPHPHGQIWAQASLPGEPAKELAHLAAWFERHDTPLLVDYAQLELARGERVVAANDHFLVVVPFWAAWPFETLLIPRRQIESLVAFRGDEERDFAELIGRVTRAYDRLFGVPFPYSSGIHQAPTDGRAYPHCTLHMHFYPPLLRSATVRKFMVGYEMLAEAQRDLTPEAGAERLRACLD